MLKHSKYSGVTTPTAAAASSTTTTTSRFLVQVLVVVLSVTTIQSCNRSVFAFTTKPNNPTPKARKPTLPTPSKSKSKFNKSNSDIKSSIQTWIIRKILDSFKTSNIVEETHLKHIQGDVAMHLFKNTPLVGMDDTLKLQFVHESWAGKLVEDIMKEEQTYLGEWKIQKIIEAAGEDTYDCNEIQAEIHHNVTTHSIVMYSFSDCPWFLAAKELLFKQQNYPTPLIIEIDEIGNKGKHIRAELAKLTKRTSMPNIYISGESIGGYTDGQPTNYNGLRSMYENGMLDELLVKEEERRRIKER